MSVDLGSAQLSLADVVAVARGSADVLLTDEAVQRMEPSRQWVDSLTEAMRAGQSVDAVYSVNTGFGSLAGKDAFTNVEDAEELSRRLIVSNACGTGAELSREVVRAAMVIRANSLIQGFSGVRPELPQLIVQMLRRGLTPVIPEYGSLGASGDLIQLAHLTLTLSRPRGEDVEHDSGQVWVDGHRKSGLAAMRDAGLERVVLGPKEGLAMTNGTSFSCAHAALALDEALRVFETAQITAAVSIEALLGFGDAFLPQIHQAAVTADRSPSPPGCGSCWPTPRSSTGTRRPTRGAIRRRTPTRCGAHPRCWGRSVRCSTSSAAWSRPRSTR